ncbi:DUF3502 domain-containing protein [Paenibacillus sp. LHD-117]|uniref:extracellular solute-binding protein n=1 Tax=Paenibacillus sp. LHD-117 TaxID=3071412 RepID=UPI0027E0BA6A|nr:extracellular solute-binding protein [Paenibacillus sp. LHD-117]MDQ6420182.1 DUF3502 domain-containing protein [Paenibacillus sp. LHD-117]
MNGTKIKGEIFGVPTIRDHASSYGFVMRKDLVDKYGIDVGAIKTYEDLEKVLKTIKDNEPAITPVVDNGTLLRTPNMDSPGTLDPEKNLPDFISKLKAAGIDKVIAEKQKQLDEWAKVNNVQ